MKLCYSISLHGNRGNNSFCLIIGYVCCKRLNILTRMHSSRMHTIRCSSHLGRGCLPARGCLPRGCLPGMRGVHLPPWTDRHLWKHNLSATTVADDKNKVVEISPGGSCPGMRACGRNFRSPQPSQIFGAKRPNQPQRRLSMSHH